MIWHNWCRDRSQTKTFSRVILCDSLKVGFEAMVHLACSRQSVAVDDIDRLLAANGRKTNCRVQDRGSSMKKRFFTRWSIGMGLFLLLLSAVPGNATLIFSDNFNNENGGVGALNYASFANWDVTRGTVDLIGNGFADFFPGNGLYVDLDGSTFASGRMESKTTFTLNPGTTYILQYELAGNYDGAPNNTVQVSLAGFSVTHSLPNDLPLTTFTDYITVSTLQSGKLIFDQIDGNNNNMGAKLDNMSLNAVSDSEVPIPATVLLFGTGLLGIAGWRGFRKKS